MSRLILFFLLLNSAGVISIKAQTSYPINSAVDIEHYNFSIQINDTTDVVEGNANILFRIDGEEMLVLDLVNQNADGIGMKVNTVMAGSVELPFEHHNNRLHIDISELASKDSLNELSIAYNGVPAGGLIIGLNKFQEKVFFGDNYPDRARNWLPCIDHPADKATVTWMVTAPSHYQVVGSGKFIDRTADVEGYSTTTWDEKVPISTKVMVFGAANFSVDKSGMVGKVPVSTWVYQQNAREGFFDFASAPEILSFYDSLVAPYPYEKLANVQSRTTYGGMENASNIFYFENSVNGQAERDELIAHEIVHQWFGNSATEADWPHAWLSEGFATYLTLVYVLKRQGQEAMNEKLVANRTRVLKYWESNPLPIVNFDIVTFPKIEHLRELLSTNTYQKGGWVLHMLQGELGEEVFWQGVRKYYNTYKNSNATTADFKSIMEEVSGQQLDQFFNQWLYGVGQPIIEGEWSYKKKKVIVNIDQIQDNLFEFPLEIGLVYGDRIEIHQVDVAGLTHTYSFEGKKPDKVVLDPDIKLLFQGDSDILFK